MFDRNFSVRRKLLLPIESLFHAPSRQPFAVEQTNAFEVECSCARSHRPELHTPHTGLAGRQSGSTCPFGRCLRLTPVAQCSFSPRRHDCRSERLHIQVSPRSNLVIRIIFNVWKRECDQCSDAILRSVPKAIFHVNLLGGYDNSRSASSTSSLFENTRPPKPTAASVSFATAYRGAFVINNAGRNSDKDKRRLKRHCCLQCRKALSAAWRPSRTASAFVRGHRQSERLPGYSASRLVERVASIGSTRETA